MTEDTHTFTLPSGEIVLIDAADRDFVESNGPWRAIRDSNTTYVVANWKRPNKLHTSIRLHRLLLDPPNDMQVDHINRNGLDNRRANLRVCTQSQNLANSPPKPGCSSEFKGISWHKRDARWHARGMDGIGKKMYLGQFTDEIEAAHAYDDFAAEQWGEFAWLNRDHFDIG